jgi:hypothetical protein
MTEVATNPLDSVAREGGEERECGLLIQAVATRLD